MLAFLPFPPLDTAPCAGLSLIPLHSLKIINATPCTLRWPSFFILFCNAWPPFFPSLTTSLPTPSSTPIPDPNTHPASPPPKQQPADTEQGRRTSLEKFTRSVVSHVELGAVHITNHTGWLTISGLFAVITMLHSVVNFF